MKTYLYKSLFFGDWSVSRAEPWRYRRFASFEAARLFLCNAREP